jgi:hypothetical protein
VAVTARVRAARAIFADSSWVFATTGAAGNVEGVVLPS